MRNNEVTTATATTTWDEMVALKVSFGYTREQAERMTPMSTAEARRRGLAINHYESPISALANRKAR